MAPHPPSRANSWALIGLAIAVEVSSILALTLWAGEVSRSGIPMWILGVLLVPFGLWCGYRSFKGLRES